MCDCLGMFVNLLAFGMGSTWMLGDWFFFFFGGGGMVF